MFGRRRHIATIATIGMATAAVVTVCVVVGVKTAYKRRQKRKKGQFLSKKTRDSITELLEEVGSEVVPGGDFGEAVFRRHLHRMKDRQLLALYAAAKAGQYAQEKGIDPLHPTPEQLAAVKSHFSRCEEEAPENREELLERIMSLGVDAAKRHLKDAVGLGALA